VSLAVTGIVLVGLMGALTWLLLYTADRAAAAPPAERARLLRVAWVLLALLGLTAVVAVWVLGRRVLLSLRAPPKRRPPQEHPSAWDVAGQRVQLPEEDDQPPDEEAPGGRQ
jgi:hypothetical protein